jgi:hypothetical protein
VSAGTLWAAWLTYSLLALVPLGLIAWDAHRAYRTLDGGRSRRAGHKANVACAFTGLGHAGFAVAGFTLGLLGMGASAAFSAAGLLAMARMVWHVPP